MYRNAFSNYIGIDTDGNVRDCCCSPYFCSPAHTVSSNACQDVAAYEKQYPDAESIVPTPMCIRTHLWDNLYWDGIELRHYGNDQLVTSGNLSHGFGNGRWLERGGQSGGGDSGRDPRDRPYWGYVEAEHRDYFPFTFGDCWDINPVNKFDERCEDYLGEWEEVTNCSGGQGSDILLHALGGWSFRRGETPAEELGNVYGDLYRSNTIKGAIDPEENLHFFMVATYSVSKWVVNFPEGMKHRIYLDLASVMCKAQCVATKRGNALSNKWLNFDQEF